MKGGSRPPAHGAEEQEAQWSPAALGPCPAVFSGRPHMWEPRRERSLVGGPPSGGVRHGLGEPPAPHGPAGEGAGTETACPAYSHCTCPSPPDRLGCLAGFTQREAQRGEGPPWLRSGNMMADWACPPPPSPGPSRWAGPYPPPGGTHRKGGPWSPARGGEGGAGLPLPGSPCGGSRGRGDKGADVGDASAPIMEDGPTHAAGLRGQPTEADGTSHRPGAESGVCTSCSPW